MKNNDELLFGHFYKIWHIGDNGNNLKHPFLYLGRNKNRGLFIQFSSVKYDENDEQENYFDDIDITQVVEGDIYDGLKLHSKGNLNSICQFKIDSELQIEHLKESSNRIWKDVLIKLKNLDYEENWVNKIIRKRLSFLG